MKSDPPIKTATSISWSSCPSWSGQSSSLSWYGLTHDVLRWESGGGVEAEEAGDNGGGLQIILIIVGLVLIDTGAHLCSTYLLCGIETAGVSVRCLLRPSSPATRKDWPRRWGKLETNSTNVATANKADGGHVYRRPLPESGAFRRRTREHPSAPRRPHPHFTGECPAPLTPITKKPMRKPIKASTPSRGGNLSRRRKRVALGVRASYR